MICPTPSLEGSDYFASKDTARVFVSQNVRLNVSYSLSGDSPCQLTDGQCDITVSDNPSIPKDYVEDLTAISYYSGQRTLQVRVSIK